MALILQVLFRRMESHSVQSRQSKEKLFSFGNLNASLYTAFWFWSLQSAIFLGIQCCPGQCSLSKCRGLLAKQTNFKEPISVQINQLLVQGATKTDKDDLYTQCNVYKRRILRVDGEMAEYKQGRTDRSGKSDLDRGSARTHKGFGSALDKKKITRALRLQLLKTMVIYMSSFYISIGYFLLYYHLIFPRVNHFDIMKGANPAYGLGAQESISSPQCRVEQKYT